MVTIKVRQNGPYLVEGEDVMLVDWNGAPYQIPSAFKAAEAGGLFSKRVPVFSACEIVAIGEVSGFRHGDESRG